MANYLRISRYLSLLCYLLLLQRQVTGQSTYYNRSYFSEYVEVLAIVPYDTSGSVMVAYNTMGPGRPVGISKFDAYGNEVARHIKHRGAASDSLFWITYNSLTWVHNNYYALCGTVEGSFGKGGFVYVVDSNCNVIKFKEFLDPFDAVTNRKPMECIASDSFGHLLVTGLTRDAGTGKQVPILYKLDTALNLLWERTYVFPEQLSLTAARGITVERDTYLVYGLTSNNTPMDFNSFRGKVMCIATDTSGAKAWHYINPGGFYRDNQAGTFSFIRCRDGGFAYAAKGGIFNKYPLDGDPGRYYAYGTLCRLDEARRYKWNTYMDKVVSHIGGGGWVYELDDGSFAYLGSVVLDSSKSTPYGEQKVSALLRVSASGVLLGPGKQLPPPRDPGDTSRNSFVVMRNICRMADGSFTVCGGYGNRTAMT
jgi:hypothetical protein